MLKNLLFIVSVGFGVNIFAQTARPYTSWVDSMDNYARNSFLPASQYQWTWQNASLLNVMVKQYEYGTPEQKKIYLDYIKRAMDKTAGVANGRKPNNVASGLGMAFLYRITKDEKYKAKCDKIYNDFLKTRRTDEGAISHIPLFTELWDDTVFMIGEFLLAMYKATGDEKYLDELVKQISLHRDKLQVKEWGLWVHGWDKNDWGHCMFCSQIHWSDKQTHRSPEIWGRGNGWIFVTLSDALEVVPRSNPHWNTLAGYLKEMVVHLPELQDMKTGHWNQLPVRNTEAENFIESSCTAMFAYGINSALRLGLVADERYQKSVQMAYDGLRNYSIVHLKEGNLTPKNVCTATCIGNKKYYFKRAVQQGKAYGLASFIQFGLTYEIDKGYRTKFVK
jgi:unsaturated rhamnogalacturonyl hydrolase